MLLLALIYALVFGVLETLTLPFRQLSSSWQVPAQWLIGRSARAQTLIWGAALGPGLVTRNPYAGIWLLPVVLTINHSFLFDVGFGLLIGAAHGTARAFSILRTSRNPDADGLRIVLTQWRWRVADGFLLLLGGGGFAAAVLAMVHPV